MAGWRNHPAHLMAVHFPTALLFMDLVFVVASVYFENEQIAYAGYYCLLGGTIAGWVTILTGLVDYFWYILRPHTGGAKAGLAHAGVQSAAVVGFTVIASVEYNHNVMIAEPPTWMWFAKGLLIVVLFAGNYLGAELLFKYVAKQFQN